MALQVWLPLDGNLENQGLANIEVINNGATISNDGKIGKCYSFNGSSYIDIGYKESFGMGNFSISAWIYITQTSGKTYQCIIGNKSTAAASAGFAIYWNQNQKKFLWSTADGSSATEIWSADTFDTIIYNSWHHIVMCRDNNDSKKGYFYLDGVRKEIASVPVIRNITSTNSLKIGSVAPTSSAYYFTGKINDVRIYDHALSYKEVKELSKGLILHYKLSKPIPNLVKDGNIEISCRSKNQEYPLKSILTTLTNGTKYTVSFEAKSLNGLGTFYCSLAQGGSSKIYFATQIKPTQNYKKYNFTAIQGSTSVNNVLFAAYYGWSGNANVTDTIYIRNVKLEEGDKATAWIPNETDTLYSAMGYNSNIEPDCSGYKRDGTIIGTITGNTDTPRYRTCNNFPSGANYINAGRGGMITDAITINFWMKCSTWGNVISCTESGGWNFEENNGLRFPVYTTDNAYRVAQSSITSASLKNNWHMLTGTYDGLIAKIYIDGEEKGSVTGSTVHKNIKYNASNVIFIGAEAGNNSSTPASNNYIGNISDFRIYCTALSADDIKALYEDAGYVDKNGNFHAYEYVEI